ncbi:MAG: hypothetical protein HY303_08205 [Candidatus Wallbacteria bacterium]|nr:hypothetical protein [Candidatus Wallbacteria bacterium]
MRLDKPEFVFSNADPEVAAGVQAWLATLQGPHDKYGNFMGPGFKGSFRPDSVNSKLIAFLATYLAGKRLVALSAGQATGLAAAQEKSRQDAVDNIVKSKRDAASRPATPPGTGTGARENVPNIKDGTSSRTSTGTTTKTSTSTPPTSNPISSTGKSKTTSSTSGSSGNPKPANTLLEQKFGGVRIDDQPKAFSSEELGFLDDALAKVPASFYERTELQRTGVLSMNGSADEQVFGLTRTGADLPRSAVQISDRSESPNSEDRIDFPTPPYSAEESKRLEFEATVDHELTHRFLRFNPGDKLYTDINQNPLISGENGWAAKFGWSFDPGKQKWSLDPVRKREAPTRYAMEDNPSEDMAESVMIYLHDPQRLRSASPERYAFVRDRLKVPEQPDAAQTYPPPRSDPRYASMFAQGN